MANGTFIRRDIWKLEESAASPPWDDYSLAYAQAVGKMKERGSDDPTSWSYQAAMHGTYRVQTDPLWNGCQHGSWFFLPWHRIYIWYFEQIVRSTVIELGGPDDWALPYWDYSDSPRTHAALPPAFREPTLPNGAANPLFVPTGRRAPGINEGSEISEAFASDTQALESTSFSPGFGGLPKAPVHFASPHGLLESQPHDNIHVAVGGRKTIANCDTALMSDPNCAALDPIFYLHHSNIDRVWAKWLAQGDGRANPAVPEWTGQTFSAYDTNGQEQSKTCGEVADLADLDYTYEELVAAAPAPPPVMAGGSPDAPSDSLPERPGNGPEIAGGAGAELGDSPASVGLDTTPDAPSILEAARDPKSPNVYLHLEDVETDALPGVVWEVLMDPDGEGKDPDLAVGVISFFGRGHSHGHEAEGQSLAIGTRFIFDITQTVQKLDAAGCWNEHEIRVTFRPVLPTESYDEAVPTVTVGRVYVTHG